MQPLLSFVATLTVLGVAFTGLHWLILILGLPDIVALLLFAIPIVAYIAYCTQDSHAERLRSAIRFYGTFVAVTLSATGLVLLID